MIWALSLAALASLPPQVREQDIAPAIVQITTATCTDYLPPLETKCIDAQAGTGTIVSDDGLILTALHVLVDGNGTLRNGLGIRPHAYQSPATQAELLAATGYKIRWVDRERDLAVLQLTRPDSEVAGRSVPLHGLPSLPIAEESSTSLWTVTGVMFPFYVNAPAVNRPANILQRRSTLDLWEYRDPRQPNNADPQLIPLFTLPHGVRWPVWFGHGAANSGNSGAPIVSDRGEILGVLSMKLPPSDYVAIPVQGALPSLNVLRSWEVADESIGRPHFTPLAHGFSASYSRRSVVSYSDSYASTCPAIADLAVAVEEMRDLTELVAQDETGSNALELASFSAIDDIVERVETSLKLIEDTRLCGDQREQLVRLSRQYTALLALRRSTGTVRTYWNVLGRALIDPMPGRVRLAPRYEDFCTGVPATYWATYSYMECFGVPIAATSNPIERAIACSMDRPICEVARARVSQLDLCEAMSSLVARGLTTEANASSCTDKHEPWQHLIDRIGPSKTWLSLAFDRQAHADVWHTLLTHQILDAEGIASLSSGTSAEVLRERTQLAGPLDALALDVQSFAIPDDARSEQLASTLVHNVQQLPARIEPSDGNLSVSAVMAAIATPEVLATATETTLNQTAWSIGLARVAETETVLQAYLEQRILQTLGDSAPRTSLRLVASSSKPVLAPADSSP